MTASERQMLMRTKAGNSADKLRQGRSVDYSVELFLLK